LALLAMVALLAEKAAAALPAVSVRVTAPLAAPLMVMPPGGRALSEESPVPGSVMVAGAEISRREVTPKNLIQS
jgi:hypothetical protein